MFLKVKELLLLSNLVLSRLGAESKLVECRVCLVYATAVDLLCECLA